MPSMLLDELRWDYRKNDQWWAWFPVVNVNVAYNTPKNTHQPGKYAIFDGNRGGHTYWWLDPIEAQAVLFYLAEKYGAPEDAARS